MSDIDNVVTLPSPNDIEAQAASWMTVLGRAEVSDSDRANFEHWLNSSDRHRTVFNELAALWDDMSVLKELDDIAVSPIVASEPQQRLWQSYSFKAVAASIMIFVLVMVGWGALPTLKSLEQQDVFITKVGEQSTVQLSDGSSLQLNTNSRVEINFSQDQRNIRLISGEVFFDVAKNKDRPFNVFAGGGSVRAVGTAFSVRILTNDDVEVVVEEGRVELNTFETQDTFESKTVPPAHQQLLAELTAGQSAVFAKKVEKLDQLPSTDMDRILAWRKGMLSYDGEPLSEVVKDVSRYIDVTIEIPDPALRAIPIAGYFRAGEVEALFDSLELGFGLRVERLSETHVRLSSLEKSLIKK